MIKLQGLDHFGIEVGDMARGVEFYSRTLGMEVQARFGHMTLMKCGRNELALFERADLSPKGQEAIKDPLGRGHWAFNVSLEDFEAARERFPREGIPCHGPVDWGDHDCLYFLDPDGNLLELISPRK
ncbi:MAG: VOC family protein [Chloroflexi bacterium]|nr:VOC family protein [Chloroflexota bacterium]